jgi:hypothetical protein
LVSTLNEELSQVNQEENEDVGKKAEWGDGGGGEGCRIPVTFINDTIWSLRNGGDLTNMYSMQSTGHKYHSEHIYISMKYYHVQKGILVNQNLK